VIFVVDEYVRLGQRDEMEKRCDRSRKDPYIVQIAVYHLLNMKVDQAFGHFDELAGSLSEHKRGAEFITDKTWTIGVMLKMGRPREIFEGTIYHPWRDETVNLRGCSPGPDEREDIRMIKLSPYEGFPRYSLHHLVR
jgi:hypothetical protein